MSAPVNIPAAGIISSPNPASVRVPSPPVRPVLGPSRNDKSLKTVFNAQPVFNKNNNNVFLRPNNNFQQANKNFQRPIDNFQEPSDNLQQPNNNFQQPNNNFQQPNNNFQQPNKNFQQPINNFQQSNNNNNFQQSNNNNNFQSSSNSNIFLGPEVSSASQPDVVRTPIRNNVQPDPTKRPKNRFLDNQARLTNLFQDDRKAKAAFNVHNKEAVTKTESELVGQETIL